MKKLLMGSIALTIFAAAIIIFQMSSCSKSIAQTSCPTCPSCPVPTYQMPGLWDGTYTVNSMPAQGQLFFSLSVYPDGSLLYKSKGGDGNYYFSKGTWTLSASNIFSATVVSFVTPSGGAGAPVTQTITATYSNTGTLTSATWTDTINPNGPLLSGAFQSMERVN